MTRELTVPRARLLQTDLQDKPELGRVIWECPPMVKLINNIGRITSKLLSSLLSFITTRALTFTDAGSSHVSQPHDDALVVTLYIDGFDVKQVLIDRSHVSLLHTILKSSSPLRLGWAKSMATSELPGNVTSILSRKLYRWTLGRAITTFGRSMTAFVEHMKGASPLLTRPYDKGTISQPLEAMPLNWSRSIYLVYSTRMSPTCCLPTCNPWTALGHLPNQGLTYSAPFRSQRSKRNS